MSELYQQQHPPYRITADDAVIGKEALLDELIDDGVLIPATDLLTREEAANAMMAFLDQHGGDVGQHWPTMEDALAWLGADDE